MKPALALAALLANAQLTAADTLTLRPEDQARLDRFASTAGTALLAAFATGKAADTDALRTALAGSPQIAFDETLAGDWKCRTIKLGGAAGLVAYTPFDCSFTFLGNSYTFEKHTGSQRTKGTIAIHNGQAIYAGVGFTADQSPPAYTDLPPEFQSNGKLQTDVALFERISPTRARLMFPAPANESDFDILELTR